MIAVYINLDRRTDRRVEAETEFEKHGLKVIRCVADEATEDCEREDGVSIGDIGCAMSHCRTVRWLKDLGIGIALVMEDDVVLADGFDPDAIAAGAPADWDMIWLGGNHVEPTLPVNGIYHRIQKTYTTHAYIIRDTAHDAVIDCLSNPTRQVDVHLSEIQKKLNCYCVRPTVAWQRESFSDILSQHVNYDFLKPMIHEGIHGWFDFDDIYLQMIDSHPDGSKFVEVGSWLGKSACFMAETLKRKGRQIDIICVDLWSKDGNDTWYDSMIDEVGDIYEQFKHNIGRIDYPVGKMRMPSVEAASRFSDGSLDFVFIDANHRYEFVKADIAAWLPKVKAGGYIGGHDYSGSPGHMGVVKAVNEAFNLTQTIKRTSWLKKV